jgi:PAS domain S-box-containing protein
MTSVLVVDDRASDRELMKVVLGYAGYEVQEMSDSEVALVVARTDRPDLIIADLLMPLMDGYEFVRSLREDPQTAGIPVIFCTATYELGEVRSLAEACGVSHVLSKPVEPEEIIRTVAEVLGTAPKMPVPTSSGQFAREHQRVLNAKLLAQVEELEHVAEEQQRLHEQLMRSQRETAESLILLETLQRTAPVGISFVDREYRIQRVNETMAAMKGVPCEEMIGRTLAEIVPDVWPEIEPVYRSVLETGEAIVNQETAGGANGAFAGQRPDGLASYYPVRLDDEIIGVGVIFVDMTERRQEDALRSAVMDTMAEGLYVVDGEGRLSLMNAAATAMLGWSEEELCGEPAHAAMHSRHEDGSPCAEDESELLRVRTLGETIRRDDAVFCCKDGTLLPVTYSAAPLVSGTAVRGAVVVFRDDTDERAERLRVQRELDALNWIGRTRDAIDESRLVLYCQPIVPLDGSGESSEELLLRMIGRDGEVIAPGRFLPAAEKYGLIGEIDRWVVRQAIERAASGKRVEANLSAESIGDRALLSLIERELRRTGADPANIVFELTETALLRDFEAAEAFAHRIVALGCGLALDDFGTGFGSFTYLKRLPVRILKIDIEFVRDLPFNPANQNLVKAIVNLASGFGQQTVAEGVEDEHTLELLREYGVDYAQGYHLGRPASIVAAAPL